MRGLPLKRLLQGTPMFMAIELSVKKLYLSHSPPNYLLSVLRNVEVLPVFDRAFPEGSVGFMAGFEKVAALETERCLSEEPTSTDTSAILHDPYHDVQSIWWCLLWGLAQALPAGQLRSKKVDTTYSYFSEYMLTASEAREMYLSSSAQFRHLLHDSLQHTSKLLTNMAAYLSTPWHRYRNNEQVKLQPEHGHHAMRRLLLTSIYTIAVEQPRTDVKLATQQPHRILCASHDADLFTNETMRQPNSADSKKRTAEAAGIDDSTRASKRARRTAHTRRKKS